MTPAPDFSEARVECPLSSLRVIDSATLDGVIADAIMVSDGSSVGMAAPVVRSFDCDPVAVTSVSMTSTIVVEPYKPILLEVDEIMVSVELIAGEAAESV